MNLSRFLFSLLAVPFLISLSPAQDLTPQKFSLKLSRAKSFSPERARSLQCFLDKVADILPQKMKEGINRPIKIIFEDMDPWFPKIINKKVFGYVNTDRFHLLDIKVLHLNKRFLKGIPENPDCQEGVYDFKTTPRKDYWDHPEGTIVHELTHIYDFNVGSTSKVPKNEDEYEKAALKTQRFSSHVKQFQKLTDWKSRPLPLRYSDKKIQLNMDSERSPNTYEFTHQNEAFAVEMEHFLLDPEFRARRPALYRYFEKFWRHSPFPDVSPIHTVIKLSDHKKVSDLSQIISLDPQRIWGIHLIYPSLMFRFILCDPARKEVSEACLEDTASHVILDYQVSLSDDRPTLGQKLLGDYFIRPHFHSLPYTVDKVTREEGKNFISIPLNLSPWEKDQFVYRALEKYHAYYGKLKINVNNPIDESVSHLKSVISHPAFLDSSSHSPQDLLKNLARHGLINKDYLKNKTDPGQWGWPSSHPELIAHFNGISEAIPQVGEKFPDVFHYLKKSTAPQRKEFMEILKNKVLESEDKKKLIVGFKILEDHIRKNVAALPGKLRDQILLHPFPSRLKVPHQRIFNITYKMKWVETLQGLERNEIEKGYGLPLAPPEGLLPEQSPFCETSSPFFKEMERFEALLAQRLQEAAPEVEGQLQAIDHNLQFLETMSR